MNESRANRRSRVELMSSRPTVSLAHSFFLSLRRRRPIQIGWNWDISDRCLVLVLNSIGSRGRVKIQSDNINNFSGATTQPASIVNNRYNSIGHFSFSHSTVAVNGIQRIGIRLADAPMNCRRLSTLLWKKTDKQEFSVFFSSFSAVHLNSLPFLFIGFTRIL